MTDPDDDRFWETQKTVEETLAFVKESDERVKAALRRHRSEEIRKLADTIDDEPTRDLEATLEDSARRQVELELDLERFARLVLADFIPRGDRDSRILLLPMQTRDATAVMEHP